MGTALISGASAGLGLEFANLFVKDGHSLILVARRRELLQQISTRLRSEHPSVQVDIVAMDLGKPGAGERLCEKIRALNREVDLPSK